LAKTVLTEWEKRELKVIASELLEIRKLVEELAETLVNLSDKELLRRCNASQDDLKEKQIDSCRETLKKQLDNAEKEFRL
jgi:hypothetical protein